MRATLLSKSLQRDLAEHGGVLTIQERLIIRN
jgi:hypothetical protein